MEFKQSKKLANVLYDIRGPILEEAQRMEARGNASSNSISATQHPSALKLPKLS